MNAPRMQCPTGGIPRENFASRAVPAPGVDPAPGATQATSCRPSVAGGYWLMRAIARGRTWLVCAATALAFGCQPSSPAPAAPGPANRTAESPSVNRPSDHSLRQGQTNTEYWDALTIENKKVGYSHTAYQSIVEQGRTLMRIVADSELTVQRFGQTIKQRMEFESVETEQGEVIRCHSKMINESSASGRVEIATNARVEGAKLALTISTHGKTESATMDWDASWGGFFATEQTLERRPMQPGETRRLRTLMAGFNQIADVEFQAIRNESTEMLIGTEELLRIEAKVTLRGTTLDQTVWTDKTGQTRKSSMAAMNQTSYRTSKEEALGQANSQFDIGVNTVVRVDPPLDRPHQTKRVFYRVSLARSSAATAFAMGATQAVRGLDEHTAEIMVRALRPQDELGIEFPADSPPGPEELAANSLVQTDDPLIQELARRIAPEAKDPWEIAVALERHVKEYLTNTNFAQALASAADVVRSREGDCTEHAVLLTALCRVRQIPARVAIGLVYSRVVGGFAYHMWTEVWIKDRWVPLDATLGLGGIGAAHLKVSHSDLRGVDPFSQFLPVLQLIGNLGVTVISAE